MKHKASLVLMEQLIMLLVFALAAAICLGLFAGAGELSRETRQLDTGVFLAQTAAEGLKAGNHPETMALPEGYRITIEEAVTDIPRFTQATITVFFREEPVYRLTTGYQEVGG